MQFIDSTRAAYPHDPGDPRQSIDAGARYIADLIRQYNGNVWAALAHYNGGGAQARAILEGRAPPAQETRRYLERIERFMGAS